MLKNIYGLTKCKKEDVYVQKTKRNINYERNDSAGLG